MPKGILFWVLMVIWFLFGFYATPKGDNYRWVIGGNLLLFLIIFILGWSEFGFVIQ